MGRAEQNKLVRTLKPKQPTACVVGARLPSGRWHSCRCHYGSSDCIWVISGHPPCVRVCAASLGAICPNSSWGGAHVKSGPYVAAIAALLLYSILTRRIGRLGVLLAVVGIFILFIGPVQNSVTNSFQSGTSEQRTAAYRSDLLSTSLTSVTLWGKPTGEANEIYGRKGQSALLDIPSEFALLSGRQGVFGLAIWIGFLVGFAYTIREARKRRDPLLLILGVALIGEWVALLSVSLITNFQCAFWLTVALTAVRLSQSAPPTQHASPSDSSAVARARLGLHVATRTEGVATGIRLQHLPFGSLWRHVLTSAKIKTDKSTSLVPYSRHERYKSTRHDPHASESSTCAVAEPLYRAKAPLRVSFAGGGTDVPPFPEREGGLVLSATINRYAHGTLRPRVDGKIRVESLDLGMALEYGAEETVDYDGKLDLVKAAIRRVAQLEEPGDRSLPTTAAPPGSGLGASSALMVNLIGLLRDYHKLSLTDYEIAHFAWEVEREDLGLRGGLQDQYAATFGGFNFIEFHPNG